jgi:hypothetical protein
MQLAEADRKAKNIVDNWTIGAAATGWLPGSTLIWTAGDLVMINQVAKAYHVKTFDEDHLRATVGGGVAAAIGGGAVIEVVGLIPVAGWAVKAAGMAAKSRLIGKAVMEYFRERSPLNAADTL